MLPLCHFALHCKANQHRTNIPFSYTGRCIPKTQRGPLQNQFKAFQRYKVHFKKSLSLPYGNQLLSSIITRPRTIRFSGACICYIYIYIILNFLLSRNRSVHFFAQIRIATFWIVSVCCYLQVCVHVEAARFGDVWNSFPGFAWALLRCTWDIAKQNRNEMNIDAQQIQQQKHVPFELPYKM